MDPMGCIYIFTLIYVIIIIKEKHMNLRGTTGEGKIRERKTGKGGKK